jgi:HSP20 family protein
MSLARIPRDRARYLAWPNSPNARDVDRLFGNFVGSLGTSALSRAPQAPQGFVPKLEISESDAAYTVSAELPGVKEKDVEVVLEDNVLTLKGEKKNGQSGPKSEESEKPEESENRAVRRSELRFGSFERRVAFRSEIDEDEVKARYTDGVLTVTLPKAEEARPKVRTVPVETA